MIGKTNAVSDGKGDIVGEKMNLSLRTNQSDHSELMGVNVRLTYADVVKDVVWNGKELTFSIPPYIPYTLSFGDVADYKKPDDLSYTSVEGNSRSAVVEYKTSVVTASIKSNQSNTEDIADATMTIDGKILKNGESAKFATGTKVTMTWSEVSDYKTPTASEMTLEGASVTIEGTYETEVVSVSVSADNGESMNVSVIIDGESFAYSGTKITKKIAFGKIYSVSVSDVEGFVTPSSVTYTADSVSRSVNMVYENSVESVTVNVSADEGNVSGYEITISKPETVGVATKYTKLEYIESTGAQYIDTGFKPSGKTKVSYDFAFTKIPGGYSGLHSTSGGLKMFGMQSKFEIYFGSITNTSVSSSTNRMSIVFNVPLGAVVVDGVFKVSGHGFKIVSSDGTLPIFAYRMGNSSNDELREYAHMKLYSCQIEDNGVLVRDYVPALRSDGIAGLYDAVNDVFYPSEGSSNFLYGESKKETIAVQTSVTGTYKIAHGTDYEVSASEVSGFIAPTTQRFISSETSRVVSMQYEAIKDETLVVNVSASDGASVDGQVVTVKQSVANGVYIEDVNGKLWTESEWNGSVTPNGVAVVTNECSFVIALQEEGTTFWSGSAVVIPDVNTETDSDNAIKDYNGIANTASIVNYLNATDGRAAHYCNRFTFPNGRKGYLGAAGEWQAVLSNQNAISSALDKCGGKYLNKQQLYWTSTQYNASKAWSIILLNNAGLNSPAKTNEYLYRPFTSLFLTQPITNGKDTLTIPNGVTYEVSVSDKDGYATPASQTFTAVGGTRTISMQYIYHAGIKNPTNGVWIQDVDGYCHMADEWTGAYTPNGIAVVTNQCSFVIALDDAGFNSWSSSNTEVKSILTTTAASTAMSDYKGFLNTEDIINQLGSDALSANLCKNFTFPNGKKGYLGAAGEWKAVLDNMLEIEKAIVKSGGDNLMSQYYSSTQYNYMRVWCLLEGDIGWIMKIGGSYSRAFTIL